jgi:hypothetical protein
MPGYEVRPLGLFSDVDWLIILIVGGFLLLGGNNTELLRTAGRMYSKVMHLRDELLKDVNQTLREEPAPKPAPAASPGVWEVGTTRTVASLPIEQRFTPPNPITSVPADGVAGNLRMGP